MTREGPYVSNLDLYLENQIGVKKASSALRCLNLLDLFRIAYVFMLQTSLYSMQVYVHESWPITTIKTGQRLFLVTAH